MHGITNIRSADMLEQQEKIAHLRQINAHLEARDYA